MPPGPVRATRREPTDETSHATAPAGFDAARNRTTSEAPESSTQRVSSAPASVSGPERETAASSVSSSKASTRRGGSTHSWPAATSMR